MLVADKASKIPRRGWPCERLPVPSGVPSAISSTRPSGRLRTDAGDFKAGGDGFRGVTKPDALHVAGIKNFMRRRLMSACVADGWSDTAG